MTHTAGFHHLGITVSNVERSKQFYVEACGMKVIAEGDGYLGLSDGHFSLWLSTSRDGVPKELKFDRNQIGLDHWSFKVTNLENLKKIEAVLKGLGVEMEDGGVTDDGYGTKDIAIFAKDPDGMKVEFHIDEKD